MLRPAGRGINLEAAATRRSVAILGGVVSIVLFLACLNLANGMMDIHTPDERIAVADLEAMVDVTLALVDAALA